MAAYLLARTIFYKIHFKQTENRKKDAIEINKILDAALSRSPDNASILAFKAFFVEVSTGTLPKTVVIPKKLIFGWFNA